MSFYIEVDQDEYPKVRQGDIIYPVPFLLLDMNVQTTVQVPEHNGKETDLSNPELIFPENTAIVARVDSMHGIVLTQDCDLAEKGIVIARVRPCLNSMDNFHSPLTKSGVNTSMDRLNNPGKAPSHFGLRPFPGMGPSEYHYADLLNLQCFPASNLELVRERIIARLGYDAKQTLQERCAYCFGRFGATAGLLWDKTETQGILDHANAIQAVQQEEDH